MSKRFWISRCFIPDFYIPPNEIFNVGLSQKSTGTTEYVEVIVYEEHLRLMRELELNLSDPRVLPDQIHRLTELIVETTSMIDRINDRVMKLEMSNKK